jgi:putative addiction module antidote
MTALKLTRIGNSVGVVLPKDILSRLRVEAGDALYLSEEPGGYRLSVYDEGVEQQMEVAEKIMRENRDVLRQLAK